MARALIFAIILAAIASMAMGAGEPAELANKTAPAAATNTATTLAAKRRDLAAQIERLDKGDDKEGAGKDADLLTVLKSIDGVYALQQARLEERQQLEVQAKEVDKELESLDKFAPDEPKPYSFLLLEGLKDQLDVAEERGKTLKTDAKSAEQLLKSAHEELDAAEKERQKHASAADKKQRSEATAAGEVSAADAPTALARAKVALKQTEVEVANLRLALSKTSQKALEKKIEVVAKDAKLLPQDRDSLLQRLAKSETALKQQRREAESHLQQVEPDKKAALKELEDGRAAKETIDAATAAWSVAAEVYQGEVAVLDQAIENRAELRRMWKRRFDLASDSVEVKKLSSWLDDLDEFRDQLQDQATSLEHRRDLTRVEAQAAGRAGDAADKEASAEEASHWQEFRQVRLRELRDVCATQLDEIHATQRTVERFRDELKAKIKKTKSVWGSTAGDTFNGLMGYEIAGDEDEPITLGRLVVLLTYLGGGILLAYLLTRLIGRSLLPRMGLHSGTVWALKSIMFYALCVLFAVVSFKLLQIPTAAFAFIGGAAAIAIGFGGQDIMNNFMSGIILLTERPIRVGDVVSISGAQGVVLHIGLRSTRLQTDVDHELIVPNKTLIDEQVTNLTLSDNFVQRFIIATLERDVDIEKAKRSMQEVAFSHPMVLKSPRPVVLLKEVETYWLTFQVHFWLEHGSFIKCALVESEILEVIGDLYKPPKEKEKDDGSGDAPAQPSPEASLLPDLQKMSRAVLSKEIKRSGGKLKIKA